MLISRAALLADMTERLTLAEAAVQATCGNCPFRKNDRRGCTYGFWAGVYRTITGCKVCKHHPAIVAFANSAATIPKH